MERFIELVQRRESCRNFSDQPVKKEQLIACIQAARLAPSACNSQPWSFVVVNSAEKSPKVAKYVQEMGLNKFAEQCPSFIVVVEEKASLSARLGGALKQQTYAPIDIGISVSYLTLEATDQGLSTCIMGCFNEDKLKALLDIPKTKRIRLVIAVGYAKDGKLREKRRKTMEQILRFAD